MATVEEIEDAFTTWIESTTDRPAFIAERMGPVPIDPYVTVDLGDINPLPHDILITNTEGTRQTVRGLCQLDVTIDVYHGDDARQVASRLKNSLQADERYTDLWRILGKGAVSTLRRLTTEYLGFLRQHVQFIISVYANIGDDYDTACFDQFRVTVNEQDIGQIAVIDVGVDPQPPDTPIIQSAESVGLDSDAVVTVLWSNVSNEIGYRLYRDGSLVVTTTENVIQANDIPGASGTYQYTVSAFNPAGESAQSSPVQVIVESAIDLRGWNINDGGIVGDNITPLIITDFETVRSPGSSNRWGIRSVASHTQSPTAPKLQIRFSLSGGSGTAYPDNTYIGFGTSDLPITDRPTDLSNQGRFIGVGNLGSPVAEFIGRITSIFGTGWFQRSLTGLDADTLYDLVLDLPSNRLELWVGGTMIDSENLHSAAEGETWFVYTFVENDSGELISVTGDYDGNSTIFVPDAIAWDTSI